MAERNATLASTVQTLLEGKKYSTIKDVLVTMEPADVAGILEAIGDARIPKIFRLLPKEQAAETRPENTILSRTAPKGLSLRPTLFEPWASSKKSKMLPSSSCMGQSVAESGSVFSFHF